MALPSSGTLSMNDIRTELGIPSQSPFGLNQARSGGYVALNIYSPSLPPSSGTCSISDWYNYCHTCNWPSFDISSGGVNSPGTGFSTNPTWTLYKNGSVYQTGRADQPSVGGGGFGTQRYFINQTFGQHFFAIGDTFRVTISNLGGISYPYSMDLTINGAYGASSTDTGTITVAASTGYHMVITLHYTSVYNIYYNVTNNNSVNYRTTNIWVNGVVTYTTSYYGIGGSFTINSGDTIQVTVVASSGEPWDATVNIYGGATYYDTQFGFPFIDSGVLTPSSDTWLNIDMGG